MHVTLGCYDMHIICSLLRRRQIVTASLAISPGL